MCISPSLLAGGVLVGCRRCWQCRSNQVKDWVGRNIAENETATVSYAVTLTYGRSYDGRADHLRSVLLTYSDIQKLLKRLRKAGYLVRYIVAGEYGSLFERAHWHGVFHFYGDHLPTEWEGEHLEYGQEEWDRIGGIQIPQWPHGHVHIKKATYAHTRYALKYLLKDQGDGQSKLCMSRNPPLGWVYFTDLAKKTAEQMLAPQDLTYRFRVRKMNGEEELMQFLLRGRMAEMYLEAYIAHWKALYGDRPRPTSELVDTFEQFGRLGDEDRLTETHVENLPGEQSVFASDGKLKNDRLQREIDGELTWEERLEDAMARSALRRKPKASKVNNHVDWYFQWMKEYGEEITEREREQLWHDCWVQARAGCIAASGLTGDEFDALSYRDQLDAINYPRSIKSKLASRRAEQLRRSRGGASRGE